MQGHYDLQPQNGTELAPGIPQLDAETRQTLEAIDPTLAKRFDEMRQHWATHGLDLSAPAIETEGERYEEELVRQMFTRHAIWDGKGCFITSNPAWQVNGTSNSSVHIRTKRFLDKMIKSTTQLIRLANPRPLMTTIGRGLSGTGRALNRARQSIPGWARTIATRYVGPTGLFLGADHGLNALVRRGTALTVHSATPATRLAATAIQQRVTALTATAMARWRTLAVHRPKLYKSLVMAVGVAALTTGGTQAADLIAEAAYNDNSTALESWTQSGMANITKDYGLTPNDTRALVHHDGIEAIENSMKTFDGFNSAITVAHIKHNVSLDDLPNKVKPIGRLPAVSLLQQALAQSDQQSETMRRLVRRAITEKPNFWRIHEAANNDDGDKTPMAGFLSLKKAAITTTTTPATTTTTTDTTSATTIQSTEQESGHQITTPALPEPQARTTNMDVAVPNLTAEDIEEKVRQHNLYCEVMRNLNRFTPSCGTTPPPAHHHLMSRALVTFLSAVAAICVLLILLCLYQWARNYHRSTQQETYTPRFPNPNLLRTHTAHHPNQAAMHTHPDMNNPNTQAAADEPPPYPNAQRTQSPARTIPTRPGQQSPDSRRASQDHFAQTFTLGMENPNSMNNTVQQ